MTAESVAKSGRLSRIASKTSCGSRSKIGIMISWALGTLEADGAIDEKEEMRIDSEQVGVRAVVNRVGYIRNDVTVCDSVSG